MDYFWKMTTEEKDELLEKAKKEISDMIENAEMNWIYYNENNSKKSPKVMKEKCEKWLPNSLYSEKLTLDIFSSACFLQEGMDLTSEGVMTINPYDIRGRYSCIHDMLWQFLMSIFDGV